MKIKKSFGTQSVIALLCAILLSACGKGEIPEQNQDTPVPTAEIVVQEDEKVSEDATTVEEMGGLLESGSGLNENYYKNVSYMGVISDLTDSTFEMGKAAMAMGHDGNPVMPLTISYDENTKVVSAILNGDNYEIYSASLEDLKEFAGDVNYMFDIIVDDTEAEQPRATEIRISKWIFE